MPTTSASGDIHQSYDGESVWGMKTRGRPRKDSKPRSPVKFLVNEDDDPIQPCKICPKMVSDEGIKCDRCSGWVHVNCSGLTWKEYEFLSTITTDAVKFFCKPCLEETKVGDEKSDARMAVQETKLDSLIKVVDTVLAQNKEIMTHLSKTETKQSDDTKEKLNEVLLEEREREKRKNNVIIYNIKESTEEEEEGMDDNERVTSILRQIVEIETPEIDSIVRLGNKNGKDGKPREKPRLVKVTFKSEEKKREVMKKAPSLNKGVQEQAKKIYINNDETDQERKAGYELRQKLKQKRQDTGDQSWVIRNGEIVQKKENRPTREEEETQ